MDLNDLNGLKVGDRVSYRDLDDEIVDRTVSGLVRNRDARLVAFYVQRMNDFEPRLAIPIDRIVQVRGNRA